jgi:uncharacterized protein CbrC (UPF0167 family)
LSEFRIRFNQSRGRLHRGTVDHVWRVFEDDKEYLCKNIVIDVPSYGAKTGEDWSICCEGTMQICKDTSTITIKPLS